MFNNSEAFASFSVDDLEAARAFYGGTLGLELAASEGGGLNIKLGGGGRVYVYPKPNHQPATFTVLNFTRRRHRSGGRRPGAKGVPMEHYDMPDFKTDAKGIMRADMDGPEAIAWFKDPAGNILSVLKQG